MIDKERARLGWGFWVLWTAGQTMAGVVSCWLGAKVPGIGFLLGPAALLIFGVVAGIVQGFALRRQGPPVWRWILISSLAGVVAAGVSFFTMLMGVIATQSSVGLLAGWACAWVVYGAVVGVLLRSIARGRPVMVASTAGWAAAGILGAVVAWATDLFLVTMPQNTLMPFPRVSLTTSVEKLILVGAVYGAVGGAVTGAALVWWLRQPALPREKVARRAEDTRRVAVVGLISGVIAAVLCSYLTPLLLFALEGSLSDLSDLVGFLGAVLADSCLCLPVFGVLSISVCMGGGWAGLAIGRARGKPNLSPWIWVGAAVGGVASYVAGSLLIYAVLGL